MHRSILAVLILPIFTAVTSGGQLCSQEPFSEAFGYSSEDFGGGSYLGVDTRDVTPDRLADPEAERRTWSGSNSGRSGRSRRQSRSQRARRNSQHQRQPGGKRRTVAPHDPRNSSGTHREPRNQPRRPASDSQSATGGPQEDLRNRRRQGIQLRHAAMPAMPAIPAMPAMPATPYVPEMDMPVSVVVVHSSARSGLMVENLTPQLGDFFGAKNGKGVLVRSVEKGSRAEQAGFRAGDVIVKVNGESISDSGDFTHAIHGRKNNAVTVSIIREKKRTKPYVDSARPQPVPDSRHGRNSRDSGYRR